MLSVPHHCPYCSAQVEGSPARRQQCKTCGQFFRVRTDASTGAKCLLTDAAAAAHDRQRRADAAPHLRAVFVPPRSGQDPMEAIRRAMKEAAKDWQWGIVRNLYAELSDLHLSRSNERDALRAILACLYLDTNGPQNTARPFAPAVPLWQPPQFDPGEIFIPDLYLLRAAELASRLGLAWPDLEGLFLAAAKKVRERASCPVQPGHAWHMIEAGMRKVGAE